ncbi:13621_t:CDS:2, partial [Ambispora leptoticha]
SDNNSDKILCCLPVNRKIPNVNHSFQIIDRKDTYAPEKFKFLKAEMSQNGGSIVILSSLVIEDLTEKKGASIEKKEK